MKVGSTEEEEMKRQQRMKVVKDMVRKIRSKGRMEANSSAVGGSVSCWPQIARKLGFMKDWKTQCRNGTTGWEG